jgi:putative membrane-bound dehydrogenase-like protein
MVVRRPIGIVLTAGVAALFAAWRAAADDEAFVVTPPGFTKPGVAKAATGVEQARLRITVRDRATGRPTPCRLNVVGPDGHFYQPEPNRLSPYGLTGQWPKTGKGNRAGKAPIRYIGRFFYATGEVAVPVPAGSVRIEAWKGLEYRPAVKVIHAAAIQSSPVTLELDHVAPMAPLGYHSGDSHLHFPRQSEADDQVIFDLLEAEDIHFGSILAYNEPPGLYTGAMETLAAPQLRGLGKASVRRRGDTWIVSGQEYRSSTYGHCNIFFCDDLVLRGQKVDADNWPLFGTLGREARRKGGFAIHAHGGYAQAIYADFVQKNVDAVELLQFGIYRGIELADWYHILNIGYRFPCVGASDYPACRKLGDCLTYVYVAGRPRDGGAAGSGDPRSGDPRRTTPEFSAWLKGTAAGCSFVTSGPLIVLDVDGQRPGAMIHEAGTGPHRVRARVRTTCEVAPIQTVQLIVNGTVVHEQTVPAEESRGRWIELDHSLDLGRSSWIAARAMSKAPSGAPDAEAHTNPVYVYLDGRAPFDRASLDRLVARLDQQMAVHRNRRFHEKAQVLDYFQKSRDILLRIRREGGLPAGGVPDDWIEDASPATLDAGRRTHTDLELARFLRPVPALTPAEALKTFETVDGFRVELVAAEPMVVSPVAAAFDADGNLYVAEMRDYPYKPRPGGRPLGAVRLLRDTDGDGRFDQSHVFADGLLWAAGITPSKGGIFVSAPPDIWYLKDTDGDFQADVRQKVYTGFGTQNPQAMVNNLTWGLDHRIYGASGGNGGIVRPADRPQAPGVSVEHSDFRFDPVTGGFEAVTGTKQFGNTFDDWGNRFVCSQDSPLYHAVLSRHDLARNPYVIVPEAIHNIAGNAVPIFRISPVERWRQIRSSRRIAHGERPAGSSGASHHIVDAAAGVTVYRGGAYPAEFDGNVFVGDAQNNLIHRRLLIPDGPTFRSVRGPREQATEFVRSSDTWFRPVNFVNAPDGTLHVLDMSREVIEAVHIPLDVVKHLDLKRGRDQGRIYRIAPPGFHYVAPPSLSQATTAELVAALLRPGGWYRDTAHRLIYERQDPAAVEPLRQLLKLKPAGAYPPLPRSRVNALWSLEGLKALRDEDLAVALGDLVPEVRAQAVALAARRLARSVSIRDTVLDLANDADSRVRFHVALALGESDDPRVATALARIARCDGANPWFRAALLSSCGSIADRLFVDLWTDANPPAPGEPPAARAEWLGQLAEVVGARNRPDEVGRVFDELARDGELGVGSPAPGAARSALRDSLVLALARGLRRSGGRLVAGADSAQSGAGLVARLVRRARAAALDERASESARVQAIADLSTIDPAGSIAVLPLLIEPRQPLAVQVAAVRSLTDSPAADADVAGLLLDRLRRFEPAVRAAAVHTLLSRAEWTKALLQAAGEGGGSERISPAFIEPADRAPLLKHRDPEIARLAQTLFGQAVSGSRARVIADYLTALRQKGDTTRGAKVFERECMTCHKVGDRGFTLGPDLTGSPSSDPSALLTHILDPNASVLPEYVQYLLVDQNGRVSTGIIAAETATSLTLRRGNGAEDTILRTQIAELTSTGLSLMPEGFEKTISKPEMADLIAFLRAAHRGGEGEAATVDDEDRSRPLDIGTLPGLIEPDE